MFEWQSGDNQITDAGDTGARGAPVTLPPAQPLLSSGAGSSTGAQQLSVGDIATLAVQVLPAPALSLHGASLCCHHASAADVTCVPWLQVHSLLPDPIPLHSLSLRLMLLQETSGAYCGSLSDACDALLS